MKKLLLLVSTLVLIIGLGACNSAPDTIDYVTRDEMELEINQLWAILEDIGVIEGLNGQREYYIQDNKVPTGVLFTKVSAFEIETLGIELDKTKAPSYILDLDGNYVPFEDLAQLLLQKYYGVGLGQGFARINFQARIQTDITSELTIDEFVARTILMFEEIRQYDWYIIGSSEFYMYLTFNGATVEVSIPIQTMRADWLTMTPEVIYNSWYEISIKHISYNNTQVQAFYDEYVTNGTFNGYVLDYK